MGKLGKPLISVLVICLIVLPLLVSAAEEEETVCGCSAAVNTATALKYKIIAIFSTLIVGVFGVCLPIFGLHRDNVLFSLVKSYGGTSILAIGVVYILPDATESSWIGDEPPWGDFPMTQVVAMAAAIITVIESFASTFMKRCYFGDQKQVLELGIMVHSVIIGIYLGASPSVSTIKRLIAALTFHQLFQGIGLGGRISQAKFELKKSLVMVIVFALTTPVGIGIGIGVAEIYNEKSLTTLMVSAFFKAAAAGRLMMYMAIAATHVNHKATGFMLLACGTVYYLVLVIKFVVSYFDLSCEICGATLDFNILFRQ